MNKYLIIIMILLVSGCRPMQDDSKTLETFAEIEIVSKENDNESNETIILPTENEIANKTTENPLKRDEIIVQFMSSNNTQDYYFCDLDKDGELEILTEMLGGTQSYLALVINDVIDGEIAEIGTIALNSTNDELEYYYNPETKEYFYYSLVVDDYKSQYSIFENFYTIDNGNLLENTMWSDISFKHGEEEELNKVIVQIHEDMKKYQLIDTIKLDVIKYYEVLADGFENIINNYRNQEPYIEIAINEEIYNYPWNTYRFTITEKFDWTELNKLPNLKFVEIDLDTVDFDYEKLYELKGICGLEINMTLENYDWLSDMNWLELLSLEECEDLYFVSNLEKLEYINVTVASQDVDFASPLLNNKNLKFVSLMRASAEQWEWLKSNLPNINQYTY